MKMGYWLEVFMDSGFNSSGSSFECVVAEGKSARLKAKKAALVMLYVLWVAVCFLIGGTTRLLVPLLALVPLSLWVLIFFTWRYTDVQYEYSFFAGELTVSRILGNRFRKELVKVHIKDLQRVMPYRENVDAVERFAAQESVFAASAVDADGLFAALWQDDEKNKSFCLYFEPDEKSLKILHYYNAIAMTRSR